MATTVDKIRRALEKRDGIAEEEMRPLAESYRKEVQAVNQRLDEAVMLLRKGLRSEAIQRVEMTPNALDAAAELQFPEWDEWNEILQFMGIPLPPKLDEDFVAQINEAIIESLPLEALLRRHRRLAIAKAPLSVRLRTLRQIARVDSSNKVWSEDVESWEKLRLQQIDAEMKRALEAEDSATLYRLHQELTENPWRAAPSSRLIEQSAFAAEAHVRNKQEAELGQIAPRLIAAFEQRDEAAARALRTKWQAARARYNLSVSDRLQSSVAPALQWLEDLDRQAMMETERESAIATLQATLDDGHSIDEVEQAFEQASRFGQAVPDSLVTKVESLRTAPKRQRQRKLVLGGIAAGVLLLGALIGGGLYLASIRQQNKERETIAAMKAFVDAGQHDEAVSYFASLQANASELAAHPKLIAMHARAKKAIDTANQRKQRFERLLAQATNDDPARIDDSLLPPLRELAETEAERSQVADLENRKQAYLAAESRRQSDAMLEKLAGYSSDFAQLQSRGSSPANRQAIDGLLTQIIRLPNQFSMLSEDALAKHEVLRSQVSSVLRRMKDEGMIAEQRADALETLSSSRSLEVFADHLREYSTQSVARTNFADFDTVLDEEDHWHNVEQINAWLNTFEKKLQGGIASTEAAELTESAESLSAVVSPNPVMAKMPDFEERMQEIRGRRRIIDETIKRILGHPLAKVVTLPVEDEASPTGITHQLIYKTYAEENADRFKRAGSLGVEVISDTLGGVRNRAFQGPLMDVSDEPMKSVLAIAESLSKNRIQYDTAWETAFIVNIANITKDKKLDGVVKEWLIHELLTGAVAGSEALRKRVPQSLAALQRRSSVREGWYQPRPSNADLNPELATTLRSELNIAYARLANPFQDYRSIAGKPLKWIGFLTKSMDGQIESQLRGATSEADGKLYVAAPSRNRSVETTLLPVGDLQKGHVQLDPNPVHQVPGRPLFLLAD
jgi:hypothetical protein